jgi:hypothetical protein
MLKLSVLQLASKRRRGFIMGNLFDVVLECVLSVTGDCVPC